MVRMVPAVTLLFASLFLAESSYAALRIKNPPQKQTYGYSKTLARENEIADQCGLERIRTASALKSAVKRGYLVPVPMRNATYELDPDPRNFDTSHKEFRYLLPDAKKMLEEIAERHFSRFGKQLKITTLMRIDPHQMALARSNARGNASNAHCQTPDQCTLHYRGNSFDISKKPMGWLERLWTLAELTRLSRENKISFWDESSNYHINVRVACGSSAPVPENKIP